MVLGFAGLATRGFSREELGDQGDRGIRVTFVQLAR